MHSQESKIETMEYVTPGKVCILCGFLKTVDSFPLTNRGFDITMGVSNYVETIALLKRYVSSQRKHEKTLTVINGYTLTVIIELEE